MPGANIDVLADSAKLSEKVTGAAVIPSVSEESLWRGRFGRGILRRYRSF
jgi:hypothetical protein